MTSPLDNLLKVSKGGLKQEAPSQSEFDGLVRSANRSAGNLPQYHERGLIRQNRHENSALTEEDYLELLTLPLYEAME